MPQTPLCHVPTFINGQKDTILCPLFPSFFLVIILCSFMKNSLIFTIVYFSNNFLSILGVLSTSVVMGTDFSVGFRLLGHNRNSNRPKFLKPELLVVINTSFLALFVEFLPFISSKTTQCTFF